MVKKLIFTVMVLSFLIMSCEATSSAVDTMFSFEEDSAKLSSVDVSNRFNVNLNFTKPVRIIDLKVIEKKTDNFQKIDYSKVESQQISITCIDGTEVGIKYDICGIVKDNNGDCFAFVTDFLGFNADPAKLVFSELILTNNSSKGRTRGYELYVQKSGNIGGLKIVNAYNNEIPYIMPACEVKKGDYILVHYSVFNEEVPSDELFNNLSSSKVKGSVDGVRDLFADVANAKNGKSDICYIEDCYKKEIQDCILYSTQYDTKWKKGAFMDNCNMLIEKGCWTGTDETKDAVNSADVSTSAVRSICRKNPEKAVLPSSKDDWYISTKGSYGAKNLNDEYIK